MGWPKQSSYLYVPENYENDSYFDLSFVLPEGRFGGQTPGDIDSLTSSCMKKVWLCVYIKTWFYGIEWDRIEKFMGKAARYMLLWECWLCLSQSTISQLSGFQHKRWIWPHTCWSVLLPLTVFCFKQDKKLPRNITNLKVEKFRSMCHSAISIFPNRILSKCIKGPWKKTQQDI